MDIENGVALPYSGKAFLVGALKRIGAGEDANVALVVKAKRGERKTSKQVAKRVNKEFAMRWIASAIRPLEEDGLGITLSEAIEKATTFGLSEDTLLYYWNNNPEMHTPSFQPPISSLPIRRTKAR